MDQQQSGQDVYAKLLDKNAFISLLVEQGLTDEAEQAKLWETFVSTFKFSLLIKIFSTLPVEQQDSMKADLDLTSTDGILKLVLKVDQGLVDKSIQVTSVETLIQEVMEEWTKAISAEMEEK